MRSALCRGSSRMNPPVPPSRHSTFSGRASLARARTTCTPTPSSPMMVLPRPRTRVFLWLFVVTLRPVELQSSHNRGDGATSLDVVVIEGKINVDDDERDEEPHEEVMPEAD